ncbi:MAG: hypothetical protein SPJ92_02575 [Bariatricus sp.]|nr:hypothetical protein [Bariatricus sp.]
MHVKAKKIAFGGLLLALTEVCIALGSVIETNTLFLLAAASYFVGAVIRESDVRTGAAFYTAGVLLGILVSPDKLYVVSYAAMGLYVLAIEFVWRSLGRLSENRNRKALFWIAKYLIFNILYIAILLGMKNVLLEGNLSVGILAGVLAAGQMGLFIYDRAYEYFQMQIWGKIRKML